MKFRTVLAAVIMGVSIGCGSASSPPTAPTPTPTTPSSPAPGTPVSIVNGASVQTTNAFAPNPITVAVGGTVTWTNNDSTTHTSTGNNNDWNSGPIVPGASFSRTFASAGSFPYHCTIHPGMVATVTVQ